MRASLDTNVIIHLYKAGLKNLLFERFDELLVYSFIRYTELKNRAESEIVASFDTDVSDGKIKLIDDGLLRQIRMYDIFNNHVRDNRIIYEASDLGEVYAIALAKTLGAISVVTDDIKERGPHYYLLREINSDILPFAFYELMLLDYLEGKIDTETYCQQFDRVNQLFEYPMSVKSKLNVFIRRFWTNPYTERDKIWMQRFCEASKVHYKQMIKELIEYINACK